MNESIAAETSDVLLVRVGRWLCALPAKHVIEVMRPLPIQPVAAGPSCVLGMSIVRGEITPVIALGVLLGSSESALPQRFVLVRAGNRHAALGVEEVLGVSIVEVDRLKSIPDLLSEALPSDVARIGVLDQSVLVLLHVIRLLPEEVWQTMASLEAAAR